MDGLRVRGAARRRQKGLTLGVLGQPGRLAAGTIRGQFKQVLLRLGRSPVFTVITLITLAAGIGANTAVFSVLEGVLLKPLPYPHSERLAAIRLTAPGINVKDFELPPSDYFVFREQSTAFQDIGLYHDDSVSVTGEAQPERVDALIVTDGMLPIRHPADAGARIQQSGRFPGAPDTAVLLTCSAPT